MLRDLKFFHQPPGAFPPAPISKRFHWLRLCLYSTVTFLPISLSLLPLKLSTRYSTLPYSSHHYKTLQYFFQVAGRLHVELSRIAGNLPHRVGDDVGSEVNLPDGLVTRQNGALSGEDDEPSMSIGSSITCQVIYMTAK